MALHVGIPTNNGSIAGNPFVASGSSTEVGPVDVRLEIEDTGQCWDFEEGRFVREEVVYRDRHWTDPNPTIGSIIAMFYDPGDGVDLRSANRVAGPDVKFSFEWRGFFDRPVDELLGSTLLQMDNRQDSDRQDLGTIKATSLVVGGPVRLRYEAPEGHAEYGTRSFIESVPLVPLSGEGEEWGIRFSIDLAAASNMLQIVKFEQMDSNGNWHEVENERYAISNAPTTDEAWTYDPIPADFETVSEYGIGINTHTGDLNPYFFHPLIGTGLMDASLIEAKFTDATGRAYLDLNLARDVDPGHSPYETEFFTDSALGIRWTANPAGGRSPVFERTRRRVSTWERVAGSQPWSWTSPTVDLPIAYTYRLVVRQLLADGSYQYGRTDYMPAEQFGVLFKVATTEPRQKDRFTRRGTSGIYWSDTLADPKSPTLQEMSRAIKLSCDISAISGLTTNHETTSFRRATSTRAIARPGRAPAPNPIITFYDAEDDTSLVRRHVPKGKVGYLILVPHGSRGAGSKVEVLKVMSGGHRDVWTAANEGAVWELQLASIEHPITTTVAYL